MAPALNEKLGCPSSSIKTANHHRFVSQTVTAPLGENRCVAETPLLRTRVNAAYPHHAGLPPPPQANDKVGLVPPDDIRLHNG